MTGPQCRTRPSARGNRGLGDPCASNDECGEGLHCDAGACGVGEAGQHRAHGAYGPPRSDRPSRFSFDLGGGIGAAFLTGARPTPSSGCS
jgi:hypothetical protein